jgi:pyruvate formate-lyase activating enzyme-like uncharacterized protein
MRTKKQNIDNTRRMIGWVYHDLKWLTEEEAKRKNQERDEILKSISNKVNYAFKQNKIYCGDLSPGCLRCGEGTWSCMFINGLCTTSCFFCPQDRKMKKERLPNADGIEFDGPNSYVDFLKKFGFRGVGFSGGETMLVFEKLLLYITRIKQEFGKNIYLWVYTNGDLVNLEKLKRLKRAGLDEIRFNISARNYDLQPVELATKFIKTVTVEVPAIPEDYEILKKCIFKMQKIGVNHLNIHQLSASEHNYRNFISRNYTFLHYPGGIPILESEIMALKLIRYVVDKNIRLSINYCAACYKEEFQARGRRKRAASLLKNDYEEETDLGYIRYLSVKDSSTNIKTIINVLRENKCQEKLWSLDDTKTEICFHHSILKYINFKKYNLTIRYSEPRFIVEASSQEEHKVTKLNSNKKIFGEEFAYHGELTSTGVESFSKLFIENINEVDVFKYFYENYSLTTKESIKNMNKEAETLMTLKTWEQLGVGFPEIC